MTTINPDDQEGIGVDQLEEPFISFGLAYTRDEINNLIASVDDDGSGRIEFGEFLRIIHNKSKLKTKEGVVFLRIENVSIFLAMRD